MVKVKAEGPPSTLQRIGQFLYTTVAAHLAAAMLSFFILVAIRSQEINPASFHIDQPHLFHMSVMVVVVSATALASLLTLGGVYLAQLVGAAVGLVMSIAVLLELYFARGIIMPWYFWALSPWITAGAGFFSGLRVAGKLDQGESYEYRPVETWDEKTVPKSYELDVPPGLPWQRMALGSAVAVFLGPIIYQALFHGLKGLFKGQHNLLELRLQESADLFWGIGLFVGAIVAGAKMPSGIRQGIGVSVVFLFAYFLVRRTAEEQMLWIVLAPVLGIIGGLVGRFMFRPDRIFTHADQRMPTDI